MLVRRALVLACWLAPVLEARSAEPPPEREEAAKHAVDAAREALEAGDFAAARTALGLAQQLDPGNSDIARLRAQLRAATPPPE